jgi:hypothetical protein
LQDKAPTWTGGAERGRAATKPDNGHEKAQECTKGRIVLVVFRGSLWRFGSVLRTRGTVQKRVFVGIAAQRDGSGLFSVRSVNSVVQNSVPEFQTCLFQGACPCEGGRRSHERRYGEGRCSGRCALLAAKLLRRSGLGFLRGGDKVPPSGEERRGFVFFVTFCRLRKLDKACRRGLKHRATSGMRPRCAMVCGWCWVGWRLIRREERG